MRIVILALGSRGDVQPFVALAVALQGRGHQVTIAAAADYAPLVTQYAVDFATVAGYVRNFMDFALVNEMLDGARNPLYFARKFYRTLDPLVTTIVADCWQAAQEADALLVSTLGLAVGMQLVEKRSIPLVAIHMHPLFPTATRPHVNFPAAPQWLPGWMPLRSTYHWLSHHLGWHGLWQALRQPLNRARRNVLALPPISPWQLYGRMAQPIPTLYAYSPLVEPLAQADRLPPQATITGCWLLPPPSTWEPPRDLVDFLAGGPPPVVISFGSILGGRDPDSMTQLLVGALVESEQRGLIYRGWGDLGNIALPESVMAFDAVPHAWLFVQAAAVVHHGGAGTTAAALHAGLPNVVVSVFGDQRLWGERVHALGAGPPPIPRQQLTSANLAAATHQAVTDPTISRTAAELGDHLAGEDGVTNAVIWLEKNVF